MAKLWESYTKAKKCQYCNRLFNAYIHNIKKGYGKFCSRTCRNIANKLGFKKGHRDFRNRKTPKDRIKGYQYDALHKWVAKQLGKPDTCWNCGRSGLSKRQINWASKSRKYKWDLSDWIRLCIKCHAKYDG